MGLHEFPVRSPVKVLMIFLGILVLGYISLQRLTISLFPDLRSPKITVIVETTGLSPEEIERVITQRLERGLITLRNVSDLTTVSRADTALATVSFEWGANMDFALLDVKKAVGELERLTEVVNITTLQYDPNALPIFTLAMTGMDDLEALNRLAEDIFKPALERMEGVAIAKVTGGLLKEVEINIDENLLMHNNLSMSQVRNAIRLSLVEASGGSVAQGNRRMRLKLMAAPTQLDDIGKVVAGYVGGLPVYLRDIASIAIVNKEPDSLVRCNGKPAVGISLYKEINANTVRVVQAVRAMLDELKKSLPKGVQIEIAYDQSIFLRTAINDLARTAAVGMGLAMAVLLVFLRNIPSTLIISLAIPLSIVATFVLMYFKDITFNLMSLGGLALGSGMLVDSAIVVLESIFAQRERGMDRRSAAVEGARQVGAAIVASTLTTCVVFLPIVFVHGVAGMLFKDFANTVIFALLASLLVAGLLVPMLCSRFLKTGGRRSSGERPIYRALLGAALSQRLLVLAAGIALVSLCPFYVKRIPMEFMPKTEEGQIVMRLRMPPGTRIEITNQAVRLIENGIAALGDAVEQTYARIGAPESDAGLQGDEVEGSHTAEIVLSLKKTKEGGLPPAEVIERLEPITRRIPDLNTQYILQQGTLADILSTGGAPILVEIEGEDLDVLVYCTEMATQTLDAIPQLHNVVNNLSQGNPEIRLLPDEAMLAGLGLSIDDIARTIRDRLQGEVVTTFESLDGTLDVRLQTRQTREEGVEHLQKMRVRGSGGRETTLAELADFESARGQQEIVRRRQKRVARVQADIREGKLSDVVGVIREELAALPLPPGYRARLSGEEEQRLESFRNLQFAFVLAFILVYMVLASVLESLIQPFTIMLTVPLAFVGVIAAFLWTGETMNLLAMIGMVMLVGIVVNNAIVMLDYVNQLRAQGIETRDALLLAGQRRLRPITMTTMTTILALLPLAMGLGEGARLQRPLALAVIGGLASSTVLTLFVIPVIYSLLDDLGKAVRRLTRRQRPAESVPPAQAVDGGQ